MTITFQASIDNSEVEMVKVYMTDLYPGLEEEYFACEVGMGVEFDAEAQRHYQMEYPAPDFLCEVNLSNANFAQILRIIDNNLYLIQQEECYYSISHEKLPEFRRKIIAAMNKNLKPFTYDSYREGNMFHGGIDVDYISGRMVQMLEIIDNAQKRGLDVHWG